MGKKTTCLIRHMISGTVALSNPGWCGWEQVFLLATRGHCHCITPWQTEIEPLNWGDFHTDNSKSSTQCALKWKFNISLLYGNWGIVVFFFPALCLLPNNCKAGRIHVVIVLLWNNSEFNFCCALYWTESCDWYLCSINCSVYTTL